MLSRLSAAAGNFNPGIARARMASTARRRASDVTGETAAPDTVTCTSTGTLTGMSTGSSGMITRPSKWARIVLVMSASYHGRGNGSSRQLVPTLDPEVAAPAVGTGVIQAADRQPPALPAGLRRPAVVLRGRRSGSGTGRGRPRGPRPTQTRASAG